MRLLKLAAFAPLGGGVRHACVLLSLSVGRLRLPAPALQYLMTNLAAGLAGASMADLLQARGCSVRTKHPPGVGWGVGGGGQAHSLG